MKIYFFLKKFCQTRKEGESKLLRIVEDKVTLLRNEIINESKSRIENINNLNQCIEV